MVSARTAIGPWLVLAPLVALLGHCSKFSAKDGAADAGAVSCVDGRCDCDGFPGNGFEIDVVGSDANNCGACGRACLPDLLNGVTTCDQGVCVAQPVSAGVPYAAVLAARGDDVYFADANPSGTASSIGGASPPSYAPRVLSRQPWPVLSLAVDDTDVYAVAAVFYNSQGHLVRLPKDGDCGGGCATVLDGVDGGQVPLQVALNGADAIWVRSPDSNDLGQLVQAPKADPSAVRVLDTRRGYNMAGEGYPALVIDGAFVFAAHRLILAGYSADGVAALPLAGCPPQLVNCVKDVVPVRALGLAADTDTLYYVALGADGGANHIGRRRDTDPVDTSFIAGRPGIGRVLAVDARDIYWVESAAVGSGVVWSLQRSGKDGTCAGYAPCPQPVATVTCPSAAQDPLCGISAIALGDTQVFFARGGAKGGVYRTPK